jgi:hypothetical protein
MTPTQRCSSTRVLAVPYLLLLPDPHLSLKTDPDPLEFKKSVADPHQSKNAGALKAQNRAVKANKRGGGGSQWSHGFRNDGPSTINHSQ